MSGAGRVRRGLPFALFAAITLVVFWKFLFLGQTIYWASYLESHRGRPWKMPGGWFEPHRPHRPVMDPILLLPASLRVYNEGLKEGELRLWNPYLFCGYPLYTDLMVHPFYPPQVALHALLSPETAYELGLLLHLFFSGAAMFWALRALKRSRPAATVGAVVWMLLGYHALWFSCAILLGISVWGPLALRGLVVARERRDFLAGTGAAAAMGMAILGSHPQHVLMLFLLLLGFLAATAERRFALRLGSWFALLSVGIGLPAVLTRLDVLVNGYHVTAPDLEELYAEPFTLLAGLPSLVAGKVLFPATAFLEQEFTIYAGLGAAALGALGAARGWRERETRLAAIVAAAALLAAFVKPLALAAQLLPVLNQSKPTRWLFLFGFCLALLAARGVDTLAEGGRSRAARVLAAVAGGWLLLMLVRAGPVRFSNGAAVETLIGFAGVAGAVLLAGRRPRAAYAVGLAALLFEMLPFFLLFNPHVDGAILREAPESVVRARAAGEPWRGAGSAGLRTASTREGLAKESMAGGNFLALYGVETVGGFDAVVPRPYARFCEAAGGEVSPAGRVATFLDFDSPLLDAANLRYLFRPFDGEPPSKYRFVERWGRSRLYENTAALPRAWVVGRVEPARDDDEATRLLKSPDFRPRESVVIDSAAPPALPPGPLASSVAWRHRGPDRAALEISASRDAVLVLADTHHPGWTATVDGREVPVHRANLAFRAVSVPAGTHAVEFRFRPASARWGILGGLAFCLVALGHAARQRRLFSSNRSNGSALPGS
jgi:hypothetical protein